MVFLILTDVLKYKKSFMAKTIRMNNQFLTNITTSLKVRIQSYNIQLNLLKIQIYKPFNSNISKGEQEASQKVITNKDIIIKKTDKGKGLVLKDKKYYRDHLVNKEHLHSYVYKEIPLDSNKKVYKQLNLFVEKYKSNLTSKETKYLTDSKWQSSNICCACKVQKCKSVQEAIALANDDYIEIY